MAGLGHSWCLAPSPALSHHVALSVTSSAKAGEGAGLPNPPTGAFALTALPSPGGHSRALSPARALRSVWAELCQPPAGAGAQRLPTGAGPRLWIPLRPCSLGVGAAGGREERARGTKHKQTTGQDRMAHAGTMTRFIIDGRAGRSLLCSVVLPQSAPCSLQLTKP